MSGQYNKDKQVSPLACVASVLFTNCDYRIQISITYWRLYTTQNMLWVKHIFVKLFFVK